MDRLLSVADALSRLLVDFEPVGTEAVHLSQAFGRVLADNVRADLDLPSFENSSMDGFAVRVVDIAAATRDSPVSLVVGGDIPAGRTTPTRLLPGQAMRIMTGAPLPEGAEAVVPVENTDFHSRTAGVAAPQSVRIYQPAVKGENLRPRGQDVCAGDIVLERGHRLRPQDIGFLAMLGKAMLQVYQRPRVAVLSTGDELTPVGIPLEAGMIYDSNSYTLAGLVSLYGGEPVTLDVAPDRAAAVRALLDRAVATGVHLILSSAGVSVGAFDYVRSVVEEQGSLSFWRVNMRPGKPLAFGSYRSVPLIGLPGNPVSAYVGFQVFARPALLKLSGVSHRNLHTQRVHLVEPVESDGRESYLRSVVVRKGDQLLARLTGHQGSGNLRSLVQANAFLIIPSGVKSLPVGEEIDAWILGDVEEDTRQVYEHT